MQRTAFGSPVEPDVKISRNRSSSGTGRSGNAGAWADRRVAVLGAVDDEHPVVGHAGVDAVEQRLRLRVDVTRSWQSVCRTSSPNCSPRYVLLMPTTTDPESAAAASQNR